VCRGFESLLRYRPDHTGRADQGGETPLDLEVERHLPSSAQMHYRPSGIGAIDNVKIARRDDRAPTLRLQGLRDLRTPR
jgi:hypothetical protein